MNTRDILNERQTTHGDFTNHANCTQELKTVFHHHLVGGLSCEQLEALDMIFHKIGRIASGNPNHKDHWDDLAGYATLVSDRLENS